MPRSKVTTWNNLRKELGRLWRLDPNEIIFRIPSDSTSRGSGPSSFNEMKSILTKLDDMVPDDVCREPAHLSRDTYNASSNRYERTHFLVGYHVPRECPLCSEDNILGYGRALRGPFGGFDDGSLSHYGGTVIHLWWNTPDGVAILACGTCIKKKRDGIK